MVIKKKQPENLFKSWTFHILAIFLHKYAKNLIFGRWTFSSSNKFKN